MQDKKIQEYLFQRIKEILPPGRSLVDTIAEVLCVSQDSAYRRIRGETLLVLEEARILCQQFNISLDQLLELSGKSTVFRNTQFDSYTPDFKTFLAGVLQQINHLHTFQEKSIIYVCRDIPLFHQLCSRAVFAFNYFLWMRNVFQHPDFVQQKFSFQHLTPDIEALGDELLSAYCKIPSVEIWNLESINGILQQLHYSVQSGIMSREDMEEVCAGLYQTLAHLQEQASYGRKFLPGENPRSKKENFQFFYNRMGLGSNSIMTLYDGKKTVYLNYEALSYIDTSDETFCDKMHEQLLTNMRRSTLISKVSEKQRNMFFNLLYAKLPRYEMNKEKMAS